MPSFYVVDNQTFRNFYRFASQYGPFCVTKRTVLQREIVRFAMPNGMYVFRVKIFRDFARWSFIFFVGEESNNHPTTTLGWPLSFVFVWGKKTTFNVLQF